MGISFKYRYKNFSNKSVFFIALITAFFMLLPFLIYDKGFFLYCGDYNSQQIPFTITLSRWFHSGLDSYSFGIDLGGSFINSYSFYTLGSPFAMLLMLFPQQTIPYLMPFMICIKFATAALTGYMYLKRYIKIPGYAVASAMLYAFSGFSVYNIFFNHFLDPVALFPLLLFSLDAFFIDDKKGAFAIAVAINLLNNYFFFTGQVVFLLIYFIVKLVVGEYKLTIKRFGVIAIETIIGLMLGMLFALPAFMSLLENPRSTSYSYGFNLLLHGTSQQYAAIISSLFLPPDPAYMPNLFTDGVIKWTSMSSYLPLFSIAGVVAFFRSKEKSFIQPVLIICLIMALVPILNSAFYAFNSSYYARWFYMPILIMTLATGKALEGSKSKLTTSVIAVALATLIYTLFGLIPNKVDGETVIGVTNRPPVFWLTIGTSILGLAILFLWIKKFKRRPCESPILLAFLCVFSVFYGVIHLATGKIPQLENDSNYKSQNYDSMNIDFFADDDDFFRVDHYNAYDNNSIFLDLNGIQFFNSVVSPSILEFYPSVGVKRDVSSKPEWSNFPLRSLLSVKYLFVPIDEEQDFLTDQTLYGFSYHKTEAGFSIYENSLYLPMGFVMNEYITEDDFNSAAEANRSALLLKGIVLNNDQIVKYASFMSEVPKNEQTLTSFDDVSADVDAMITADDFTDTGNGFTANVFTDKQSLVMFSVPYDKGFTAYVNGIETPVEKVNNGLTAIAVTAGYSSIVFEYKTPFLNVSMVLCFIGIVLYIVYILFIRFYSVAKSKVIKD